MQHKNNAYVAIGHAVDVDSAATYNGVLVVNKPEHLVQIDQL